MIASFGSVYGQSLTISGTVTDKADGTPLGGVAIFKKNEPDSGLVTDVNGKYTLTVEKGDSLVFSYFGYLRQIIKVENEIPNVALEVEILPEGVMTFTDAKTTVIGQVTSVSISDLIASSPGFDGFANEKSRKTSDLLQEIAGNVSLPIITIPKNDLIQPAVKIQSDTYEIEKLSAPEPGKLITVPPEALFLNVDKNFLRLSVPGDLVNFGTRPVITGYLRAYQNHYPVTISPDIAWLLICQGFSQHVTRNSEELRSMFVDFEGKKELIVQRDMTGTEGLAVFPWETVFPEFTQKISTYTGQELIENLSSDFTTTTHSSLIASQISIMESMKNFFNYKVFMAGCGIPEVTIEGTTEDWQKIRTRLDYLAQFDLKWWTSELAPIIDQIIKTKKTGKLDKKFWMNMIKYHKVGLYGSYDGVDGWFLKFYPYTNNGTRSDFKEIKGVGVLPDEFSCVPFNFEIQDPKTNFSVSYKMEFWSGFFGVQHDEKTYNVKPAIGWAINFKGE